MFSHHQQTLKDGELARAPVLNYAASLPTFTTSCKHVMLLWAEGGTPLGTTWFWRLQWSFDIRKEDSSNQLHYGRWAGDKKKAEVWRVRGLDILVSDLRPDVTLLDGEGRKIILGELTVPWEESIGDARQRKLDRYEELRVEIGERGWKVEVIPFEADCCGSSQLQWVASWSWLVLVEVDRWQKRWERESGRRQYLDSTGLGATGNGCCVPTIVRDPELNGSKSRWLVALSWGPRLWAVMRIFYHRTRTPLCLHVISNNT